MKLICKSNMKERRKGMRTKSLLMHAHEASAAASMYLAAGSHNVPIILA